MNLDHQESKFHLLAVSELLALFQQEVEVHTVYQRLFKKAGKGLRSMQHLFFMLLLC